MSPDATIARLGLPQPPPNWCEHELWVPAGGAVSPPDADALLEPAPDVAVAQMPSARRPRRRRDIGRSLFRTFDMARRRCGRGQTIRLGGA